MNAIILATKGMLATEVYKSDLVVVEKIQVLIDIEEPIIDVEINDVVIDIEVKDK